MCISLHLTTWEKMRELTNFPLTSAGQGNMCFPLQAGGYRNNGIILLNVAFFLGKWWITSRGKRKGMGRNKMDNREKDRRNLDIRGEGEAEERRVRPWTRGRRNKLPHMWILTNSYPPSFWAAWNIVQRLTVGDRRQTKPLETLGKDLSWSVWRHMQSLHQRQRGRNTVLQEGK